MMNDPKVRLMHYDPRWRQEFQQTRSSILQSCLGWVTQVEHIGSTAISGLIARPTIDILAGIDSQADDRIERQSKTLANVFDESADLIEGLNFRREVRPPPQSDWRGEQSLGQSRCGWAPEAITLIKPRHGEATHCVYLMTIDCPAWRDAIAIRQRLQADRELALRFEETKVARWRNGQGDPDRYASDKAIFLRHLLDQLDPGDRQN